MMASFFCHGQLLEIPVVFPEGQTMAADKLAGLISRVTMDTLLADIAREVNEACYAQSDYRPTQADHDELAADLQILDINAYAADAVLRLASPTFLPDMFISCQLSYQGRRKNLEIYDKPR